MSKTLDALVIILNLPKYPGRLLRMTNRLRHVGFKNIEVIYGPPLDDPDFRAWIGETDTLGRDKILSLSWSHMLAHKYFLNSKFDQCFILEDDTLFHNKFIEYFDRMWENRQPDIDSVLLSPYYISLDLNPMVSENMIRINGNCMSTACYYTTRPFSEYVVKKYDIPYENYDFRNHHTPEYFLMQSKTTGVSRWPLAMEDCIDSNLSHDEHMNQKRRYWEQYFPWTHFDECDSFQWVRSGSRVL